MRLTRKHKIIIAVTSVFILVNILLIYFDTEQKVSKTSHVKEWTSVGEKDMYESIDTKGVLDFSEESFVYFDDNLGEFQSFLVEEGQQVNMGEDLYSYEVRNYFETASQLEGEIEKLSSQMTAIEAAITKMESFQIPSSGASMPPQTSTTPPVNEDDGGTSDGDPLMEQFLQEMNQVQDSGQAELIKEQYITENEKELAQKEAEHNSVESQLSELTSTGETVTVESPYEGIVTGVSETLEDPLLTIQSDDLVVKGDLTEKEHLDVEQEQLVYITMTQSGVEEEGQIEEVSQIPEEISLKGHSKYPFIVSLLDEEADDEDQETDSGDLDDDQDQEADQNQDQNQDQETDKESDEDQSDDLDISESMQEEEDIHFPGYHANLEIITKESPNASVVNKANLDGQAIWLLTSNGDIIKNPVKSGIEMDSIIEIIEGAETGDWIAIEPIDRFTSHSPFITSLDVKELNANRVKSNRWLKDLMTGLISR